MDAELPGERRDQVVEEVPSDVERTDPDERSEDDVTAERGETPAPTAEVSDTDEADTGVSDTYEPAHQDSLRPVDVVGLVLLLVGGAALPPLGYLVGCGLIGASRRWSVTTRVVLAGVPALLALLLVVRYGLGYSPAALVTDPASEAGEFVNIGLMALPFTAAQVAALIGARFLALQAEREEAEAQATSWKQRAS